MKRANRNGPANKYRRRKRVVLTASRVRSAITNGLAILKDVDHRSAWMRRLRDLMRAHESDLGGYDTLSEGQKALVRRIAMIEVQLEMLEHHFAENNGSAGRLDLEVYQRCSNSMRRLLESLDLNEGRKARDINEYDPQVAQDVARLRESGFIDALNEGDGAAP